jgi:hypothetical protein
MLPRTYPHLHLHRMGGSAEGRKSAQRRSAPRLVTQRGPWSGAADQLEDPCGVHWALRTTGGHEPLERVAVTSRPRRAVYSTPRLRALPSLADSLTSRAPGGTTVSRFLTSATTLLAVMSWAAPVLAETLRVQLPWTHQGAVRWVLRCRCAPLLPARGSGRVDHAGRDVAGRSIAQHGRRCARGLGSTRCSLIAAAKAASRSPPRGQGPPERALRYSLAGAAASHRLSFQQ